MNAWRIKGLSLIELRLVVAVLAGPVAMPEGVAFYCAVYPNIDGVAWTSRLILNGIELGHAGYRIYRFGADYNSDKTISKSNTRWTMLTSRARRPGRTSWSSPAASPI